LQTSQVSLSCLYRKRIDENSSNQYFSAAFYEDSNIRNYILQDDLELIELAVVEAKNRGLKRACRPENMFPFAWETVNLELLKGNHRDKLDNYEGLRIVLLLLLLVHTREWKSSLKEIVVYIRKYKDDIWLKSLCFLCIFWASVGSLDVRFLYFVLLFLCAVANC